MTSAQASSWLAFRPHRWETTAPATRSAPAHRPPVAGTPRPGGCRRALRRRSRCAGRQRPRPRPACTRPPPRPAAPGASGSCAPTWVPAMRWWWPHAGRYARPHRGNHRWPVWGRRSGTAPDRRRRRGRRHLRIRARRSATGVHRCPGTRPPGRPHTAGAGRARGRRHASPPARWPRRRSCRRNPAPAAAA